MNNADELILVVGGCTSSATHSASTYLTRLRGLVKEVQSSDGRNQLCNAKLGTIDKVRLSHAKGFSPKPFENLRLIGRMRYKRIPAGAGIPKPL